MKSFSKNNHNESNYSKEFSSYDEKRNFNNYQKNHEIILYNNNFYEHQKPLNLGGTRNCLYINNYPYISIGKNISLPLLVILFMCILYIYIYYFFFEDSGLLLQKSFNYCFLLYIISHSLSIFLNPGIPSFEYNNEIKQGLKSKNLNELDCSKCKICKLHYKLIDRIGHCEKCEICYFGYDHHCMWIGHCIAKNNNMFFILLILSLFIFIFICFAMVFVKILKIFKIR